MSEIINDIFIDDQSDLQKEGPGPRVPEKTEMFIPSEAMTYIHGCDFPETSDYAIVAAEIVEAFGQNGKISGVIVDVCPGPGNLSGELLRVGADKVIAIDGDAVMLGHINTKFQNEIAMGQIECIQATAQQLPLPDASVNGIVNFNSFHQFRSGERALMALREMARVLKPGGWGLVRDFQRGAPDEAVAKRLEHTKEEIKPLLLESLTAAFTSEEFLDMLRQIPDIEFSVKPTETPWRLSEELCARIRHDPVEHWRDSGISQHVVIKKVTAKEAL